VQKQILFAILPRRGVRREAEDARYAISTALRFAFVGEIRAFADELSAFVENILIGCARILFLFRI